MNGIAALNGSISHHDWRGARISYEGVTIDVKRPMWGLRWLFGDRVTLTVETSGQDYYNGTRSKVRKTSRTEAAEEIKRTAEIIGLRDRLGSYRLMTRELNTGGPVGMLGTTATARIKIGSTTEFLPKLVDRVGISVSANLIFQRWFRSERLEPVELKPAVNA